MTKVMIVDGDRGMRWTLRALLENAGYTVTEAQDGLSAMATLYTSRHPMVVLLRDYLEWGDSAEVLLESTDNGPLARHAFVLLASGRPPTYSSALQYVRVTHAVPVVRIPVDIEVLLRTVAQSVRHLPRLPRARARHS